MILPNKYTPSPSIGDIYSVTMIEYVTQIAVKTFRFSIREVTVFNSKYTAMPSLFFLIIYYNSRIQYNDNDAGKRNS